MRTSFHVLPLVAPNRWTPVIGGRYRAGVPVWVPTEGEGSACPRRCVSLLFMS